MDDNVDKLRRRIREEQESLATPIDFDQLIANGVLRKTKGGWYQVLDGRKLPSALMKRAHRMKTSAKKGLLFQFRHTERRAAQN